MNILFISSQPYPYGMAASKRIRLFAEHLAINNTVFAWVCGRNNGLNNHTGSFKGVEWHFEKFNRWDYFLNFFKIFKILKSNFRKDKENVLMLYDGIGLTNIGFAYFGRKMGFKIFTDIVEDYSVHEENTGILLTCLHKINQIFDKKITKYVDGLVVISKRLYEKYLILGVNSQKITLIPIIAENLVENYDKKSNNKFSFVYGGTFGIKDGVSVLIESFKLLSKKYQPIELVLSGKINPDIQRLIDNEPNIKYVGRIPDSEYYQFLSNADVLCMTRIDSKYAHSGFPFKLGEYLATGVPVIVTEVSDITYYLRDKESALIAKPSNIQSLYSKMEFAFQNQDFILNIGANGKEVAKKYFNKEINGQKLEFFISTI